MMNNPVDRQTDLSVLLADGHALFRGGMRYLLAGLPYTVEVTEAATRTETLEALRQKRFDLIMLEILMSDCAPAPLLDDVRTEAAGTPVVVVSAVSEPDDIQAALENGASGFIPKSSAPKIMLQAVMLVLSGGIYVPPAVLKLMRHDATDTGPPNSSLSRSASPLTERHRVVLSHLAEGLSNKQIAHALGVSEGTVKAHIASLFRVLGARNRAQAIIVAAQQGLLVGSLSPRKSNTPEQR